MVSYNLVVSTNNLNALRQFNVFLSNYLLWDKPGTLERWLVRKARVFVEKQAFKAFSEIRKEITLNKVSMGLNDCPTPMFATLYVASQSFVPLSGNELFTILADAELQLERLKKPRPATEYQPLPVEDTPQEENPEA